MQLQQYKQQNVDEKIEYYKWLQQKIADLIDVEIEFQEQYPIKLSQCMIKSLKKQIIKNNFQKGITHDNVKRNRIQSEIIISKIFAQKLQKKYQKKQQELDKVCIRKQKQENCLQLRIPFGNILCLGKKSCSTILVMLKDQDKVIQRDEDGYELVSDSDEQQEYEQKEKEQYRKIIEWIDKGGNVKVELKRKCKMMLQIKERKQGNLTDLNMQWRQKSQMRINNQTVRVVENGQKEKRNLDKGNEKEEYDKIERLYRTLLEKMEQYERIQKLTKGQQENGMQQKFQMGEIEADMMGNLEGMMDLDGMGLYGGMNGMEQCDEDGQDQDDQGDQDEGCLESEEGCQNDANEGTGVKEEEENGMSAQMNDCMDLQYRSDQ